MAFDFAKLKKTVRRVVHKTLGVTALYVDNDMSTAVPIKTRWHNKLVLEGDLDNQGYAQVLEGLDKVVFDAAEARALSVRRGGTLSFPDYQNITFSLGNRQPSTGPFEEVWEVARKE